MPSGSPAHTPNTPLSTSISFIRPRDSLTRDDLAQGSLTIASRKFLNRCVANLGSLPTLLFFPTTTTVVLCKTTFYVVFLIWETLVSQEVASTWLEDTLSSSFVRNIRGL